MESTRREQTNLLKLSPRSRIFLTIRTFNKTEVKQSLSSFPSWFIQPDLSIWREERKWGMVCIRNCTAMVRRVVRV